jgi:hypothetical protein
MLEDLEIAEDAEGMALNEQNELPPRRLAP